MENEYILLPSHLSGFINTNTGAGSTPSGLPAYYLHGELESDRHAQFCPRCGGKMHVHQGKDTALKTMPCGNVACIVTFTRHQYACPCCGMTKVPKVPFQAKGHRITTALRDYVLALLELGFRNSEINVITGLSKNTIKAIDMKRLESHYTERVPDGEGGYRRVLRKPDWQARFLAIDEFKLHNGHCYATIIIDLESGKALWLAKGRKKQVVYDFIDYVGEEWMAGVKAVACDMNSDFQEAFQERCGKDVRIVFDHFHIIKNFNDKVVSEVRKDEQRRLLAEGDKEGAAALKKTKYILTSSRETLARKDREAREGKRVRKKSELFKIPEETRKGGQLKRYEELIMANELLFTLDLVKANLQLAFELDDEALMEEKILEIIEICKETGNSHFLGFARLLSNHLDGIVAHATYHISTSKLEGVNNKIKTMRRAAYGYPDDEYFFLKIIDQTRRERQC